ncbi:MAG: RNA 2',3'-cyclic phosphodiesterase, partial [Planctomycetota bacterium]
RLFIAIPIPHEGKEKILKMIEALQEFSFRWTKAENLHLTLKFIGNWPVSRLSNLMELLENAGKDIPPFKIEFSHISAIPDWSRMRILSLEGKPAPPLTKLVENLENLLLSLGVEKEKREFRPHITLGRISKKKPITDISRLREKAEKTFQFLSFLVKNIILYESQLTPKGPIYTSLKKFPLDGSH